MSNLEDQLAIHIAMLKLPSPTREHRFHPVRKWRFDFAWPDFLLAVEVEGGTYANGRHNRASGFAADCAKYNAAQCMGWRVLRFTGAMVDPGEDVTIIEQQLKKLEVEI